VIDGGRVIEEGTAQELKSRLASEVLEIHFADRPTLRVPVHEPDDVRRALEQHPDAERIELHQPSLDDVFLAVTR
jgi:ABC-2 type transport system ATP-binding protein